jgi:hypothetical protein
MARNSHGGELVEKRLEIRFNTQAEADTYITELNGAGVTSTGLHSGLTLRTEDNRFIVSVPATFHAEYRTALTNIGYTLVNGDLRVTGLASLSVASMST